MISENVVPTCVRNINTEAHDREITLQPMMHFKQTQTKEMQTNFLLAFNCWFKVQDVQFNKIIKFINDMMHSLEVTDDIVDNSVMRYGIPTAHLVYGRCRTIYAILGTFPVVVNNIIELGRHEFVDDLLKTGMNLLNGQGVELYFQNAVKCPTEEEYFEIAANKTVPFIELILKLLQVTGQTNQNLNLHRFAKKLGMYGQIYNDYICFKSSAYQNVKKFCEDVTEGKFTFPIIHVIRTHPEETQIMNILKQRTSDSEVKKHFLSLLEKYGSLDYTLNMLTKLKKECFEEMEKSIENPEMKELLDFILNNIDTLLM